jgi:hypothetical protein
MRQLIAGYDTRGEKKAELAMALAKENPCTANPPVPGLR